MYHLIYNELSKDFVTMRPIRSKLFAYTVKYLEVDGTIFYKFKLPEVHICTLGNLDL